MTTPFLTDAEIMDICRPLTQPAAMVRRLRDMGFFVKTRPNGWPLISRVNFADVMSGQTTPQTTDRPEPERSGPDVQALLDRFKTSGARYDDGQKTQIESSRVT